MAANVARLVFIDYDDTLVSQPHRAVERACKLLGKRCPTDQQFRNRSSVHIYESFPESFRDSREMWAVGLLAVPLGYFRSQIPLEYSVSEMAEVLRDQRVCVLSKNPPAFTPWRVRRLREIFGVNIGDRYIACGPLIGKAPSKVEIIKEVASYHQIPLDACLLVDDSDETICSAAAAGIQTALIDSTWNQKANLPSESRRIHTTEMPSLVATHLGGTKVDDTSRKFIVPSMSPTALLKFAWLRLMRRSIYGENLFSGKTYVLARSPMMAPFYWDPHATYHRRLEKLLRLPDGLHGARLVAFRPHCRVSHLPLAVQKDCLSAPEQDRVTSFKLACRELLHKRGHYTGKASLFLFNALDRRRERQRVLGSDRVKTAIKSYVKNHSVSHAEAESRAAKYAQDMVAGQTYIGCLITMTVFNCMIWLFKSLHVQNESVVRDLEQEHFIIYAAVHRSYLDSAILLACIANQTNNFPFVAAADKMRRVWSGRLGWLSGAFFLQRKLGDEIYTSIMAEHISGMHAPGKCFEIFLEGQRSRSGLTLPPKKGIASIIWRNISKGEDPRRSTVVIPVAFTYNKLPESELLLFEGHNERKKLGAVSLREEADIRIKTRRPRSPLDRIRSTLRHLTSSPVSECYMSYGEPIFLQRTQDGNEELERYLYNTMRRINAVTQALPSSVLCLALLSATDHHLRREDAARFLDLAKEILQLYGRHEQVHPALYAKSTDDQIQEFIDLPFVNRKFKRHRVKEREIISLDGLDIERSTYYKNNILHFFVLPALLVSVLVDSRIGRVEELHRFLDHMFEKLVAKYFLPDTENQPYFIDQILGLLQTRALLSLSDAAYVVNFESDSFQSVRILANLGGTVVQEDLREVFESFRRSYQRIDVSLSARLTLVEREVSKAATICATEDKGIFLYSEDAPQVGDTVRLKPEGSSLSCAGTVARQESDGAFIRVFDDSLYALIDPGPEAIKRDFKCAYSYQRSMDASAQVASISPSGAWLTTDVDLRSGDLVAAAIDLGNASLRVTGQVMRASSGGAGVKFSGMTPAQEAELTVHLARLAAEVRSEDNQPAHKANQSDE